MKKAMMIVAMIGVIGLAGVADAQIVQDESVYSDYTGGPIVVGSYDEPAGGDDAYHYNRPSDAPAGGRFWTPLLTGTYVVEASWAAENHNSNVDYYFRSDGTAPSEAAIAGAQDVDQKLMADQVTPRPAGSATWSGYFELGTFDLIPASTFRIHDLDAPSDPISAGVWQFSEPGGAVPEPGSFALLALGLGGMLGLKRRK